MDKVEYDIPEAAIRMNFTPSYVRKLIREGSITTEFKPIAEGSLVKKHFLSEEEVQRFFLETPRKTHRVDGRNKYVIYMSPSEFATVKLLLTKNELKDVATTIRTWNKLKEPVRPIKLVEQKPRRKTKNAI